MSTEHEPRRERISKRLVRVWFGTVASTAVVLSGLLIHDFFRGEGISHLGLAYMLEMAAVVLLVVSVILLPLLMIAVVMHRKART